MSKKNYIGWVLQHKTTGEFYSATADYTRE